MTAKYVSFKGRAVITYRCMVLDNYKQKCDFW